MDAAPCATSAASPESERFAHHSVPVKTVIASAPVVPVVPTDADLAEFETKGRELWDRVGRPRYVAAPMVAGSDLSFRLQVRRHGVQLAYSPMLNANIMAQSGCFNGYTAKSLTTTSDARDRPLFVQIAGKTPEIVAEAGRRLERDLGDHIDAIDLNFGCPQNCAKRAGYGAFVLEDAEQTLKVVQALSRSVRLPVTCKIRLLPRMEDTILLARRMVAAGCQLLAVHGRTRHEKGPATANADWDSIAAIRRAVGVPVLANGGTPSLFEAETCLRVTGAHAVMVSEALLEDPAFFCRPLSPMESKLLPPADFWRCLDPKPWDSSRQLHIALSKHYRATWADSSRARAAKATDSALSDLVPGPGGASETGDDVDKACPDGGSGAASASSAPGAPEVGIPVEPGAAAWAHCLGLKEQDAEVVRTAKTYLSAVPLAPRAGLAGATAGIDAIGLAEEYLDTCEKHGCQIKELRVHLFRILFGLLHTHPDLRRAMDAGTPEIRRLFKRECAAADRVSRRHRAAAAGFLLSHLPHANGRPQPPPLVQAQMFLMRSILAKLRARVIAGWPRIATRELADCPLPAAASLPSSPSASAASEGLPFGLVDLFPALGTIAANPKEPLQPAVLSTTVAQAAATLASEGAGSPWILRRPLANSLPAVTVRTDAVPWAGAAPSVLPAALAPPISADGGWSTPASRPSVAEAWPDVDEAAAGRMFRKWPPTCCRDLQRRPGIPEGMDSVRPGFWYFRHVLEPLEARTIASLTMHPTVAALLMDPTAQPGENGVPADIAASVEAHVAGIPRLALPAELLAQPQATPPGKRSLARQQQQQPSEAGTETSPGTVAAVVTEPNSAPKRGKPSVE